MLNTCPFPFPTLSQLALALYASARRIERVPSVVEVHPYEIATRDTAGAIVADRFSPLATAWEVL